MSWTKLELTWPGKNKAFELEPRILIEKPELSYWDKDTENMLIHWDNLLALKALEQQFTWKIKCIYIDPPYNTGSAFEFYDDGLEHTEWLNLMRPRLELLKNLLSEDWIIFIQIDDNEQAYLKVLLDEVFWRDNFVNTIVIKMSPEWWLKTTHKEKTIIKIKEYVHVYSKNKDYVKFNPQYIENKEYNTEYERYVENINDDPSEWKIERLYKILQDNWFDVKNDLSNLDLDNEELKEFLIKNSNRIRYRTRLPKWIAEELADRFNTVVEYAPGQFWYKWRRMSFLNKTLKPILIDWEYKLTFAKLLWDLYTDIVIQKIFNEWWVVFNNGKKPEDLVSRFIAMTSDENDLILDSFLWSWTTAAVAHKMKRKRIWIELWDHAYSHCKTRLDNVINNLDTWWISKQYNRQWWGWYKFYELWPSVLLQDKYWNYIINPNFNSSELVQAICKIENFTYKAYEDNIKHGYSTEKDFIHVTTRHITQEIIKDIQETSLKNWETMLIVAKTFESNLDLPDNIQIKKIPTEILDKCEYNKDNYSLPITKEGIDEE